MVLIFPLWVHLTSATADFGQHYRHPFLLSVSEKAADVVIDRSDLAAVFSAIQRISGCVTGQGIDRDCVQKIVARLTPVQRRDLAGFADFLGATTPPRSDPDDDPPWAALGMPSASSR